MLTYEVNSGKLGEIKPLDEEMVCEQIERIVRSHGLQMTQKTTLSTKKGSYHWHFQKEKEKGVLEVTYWPKKGELRIDIHDNRRTEWNTGIIEPLAETFADYFQGNVQKQT